MKYTVTYFEKDEEGNWVVSGEIEFDNFNEALEEMNFNYFACIDKEIEYEDIICWKTIARSNYYAEVYGK